MTRFALLLAAVVISLSTSLLAADSEKRAPAAAENWPMWRGPRGDGTSLEAKIPTKWDGKTGDNIAWKVEIPGRGHSSPIVWQDRVFVVTCLEDLSLIHI